MSVYFTLVYFRLSGLVGEIVAVHFHSNPRQTGEMANSFCRAVPERFPDDTTWKNQNASQTRIAPNLVRFMRKRSRTNVDETICAGHTVKKKNVGWAADRYIVSFDKIDPIYKLSSYVLQSVYTYITTIYYIYIVCVCVCKYTRSPHTKRFIMQTAYRGVLFGILSICSVRRRRTFLNRRRRRRPRPSPARLPRSER